MGSRVLHVSRGQQLLREWRGSLTQVAAAEIFDVDSSVYNKFESGVRRPGGRWSSRIEALTDGKVPASSWWRPPAPTSEVA